MRSSGARLDALATEIRELAPPGDEKSIVFCDTGRMVDRAVAQRAGLGWYGKNTNILTKGWGSWVFLSEIVTSLPLVAGCAARHHLRHVRGLPPRLPH